MVRRDLKTCIQQLTHTAHRTVSSNPEQVEICHVCDRAYVMREGRIAGHLTRSELTEENIVRLGMHHA